MVTLPPCVTDTLDDFALQVTWVVTSWVVPSEYEAVAVAWHVVQPEKPWGQLTDALSPVCTTPCAVRTVLPEIPPLVAVMVVVPAIFRFVAKPKGETVTFEVSDELQVTMLVIS